jgi:hypothetical protein
MIITRDVHFHEDEQWDWKDSENYKLFEDQDKSQWQDELVDDSPIKGTKSFTDIYQRRHVAVCELDGYEKALKNSKWQKEMEEEISIIQKNST